jgi:hypothetical protein
VDQGVCGEEENTFKITPTTSVCIGMCNLCLYLMRGCMQVQGQA